MTIRAIGPLLCGCLLVLAATTGTLAEGRSKSVVIPTDSRDSYYVGTANGGVWKQEVARPGNQIDPSVGVRKKKTFGVGENSSPIPRDR